MTDQHLLDIVNHYAHVIMAKIEPMRLSEEGYDMQKIPAQRMLQHLKWMCLQIVENQIEGSKSHRWLGYIQGELRGMGIFSVNELKQHSRPTG